MSDELGGAPSNGAADGGVQSSGADVAQVSGGVSDAVAEKPSGSTREALEKAFATVSGEAPAAKPAVAGVRDPMTGQFTKQAADAKMAAAPKMPGSEPGKVDPGKAPDPAGLDAKPAVGAPPAGFTKAAQEAWANTPEAVRADTERRLGELTQGMEKYKAEATEFGTIREFHDLAKQSGTTLKDALTNYVGIDKQLRTDFTGAMSQIMRNIGVDPRQGIAALVQFVNGEQGGQPQAGGASPAETALRSQLAERDQKIAALEERFGSFEQKITSSETAKTIEQFASAHPHFDALSADIAEMLETGYAKNLSDAYEKAVRLNPEIAAKIEADKAPKADPAAQTRIKAGLSVTGSPSPGSSPAARKPAGSIREALETARSQVSP